MIQSYQVVMAQCSLSQSVLKLLHVRGRQILLGVRTFSFFASGNLIYIKCWVYCGEGSDCLMSTVPSVCTVHVRDGGQR